MKMYYRRPLRHKRPRPHRLLTPPVAMPNPDSARTTEALVPMRALTLIYHEDFETEITGLIQQKMLVARYTRIRDVVGARADIMQEADIAPDGRNNMLIIVATEQVVLELADAFRTLRQVHGHGLRGYITPVEGLI